MQNEIHDLRRDNMRLREACEKSQEEQREIKNQIEQCEKMMNSKD